MLYGRIILDKPGCKNKRIVIIIADAVLKSIKEGKHLGPVAIFGKEREHRVVYNKQTEEFEIITERDQ